MCHWNTGVMGADNGPLCAYVDIPYRICHSLATIVIYNINNVYTVLLINLMLFEWTKNVLFFQKQGHF
jgi:hypothetical protein